MQGWIGSVTVNGVTSGTVGSGIVSGTMTFNGLVPSCISAMSGLTGQNTPAIAQSICIGLNGSLSGTTYTGQSTGVSAGSDQSLVSSANAATLATALEEAHRGICGGLGGTGASVPGFYQGIALAIISVVMTGNGIGSVTPIGESSPVSGIGVSVSVIG